VISTPPGATSLVTIYRSEVIKDNLSPNWKPFSINAVDVGGFDAPFTVEVYDFDSDGGHDIIGSTTCTLRDWTFGWWAGALQASGKSSSQGSLNIDNVQVRSSSRLSYK